MAKMKTSEQSMERQSDQCAAVVQNNLTLNENNTIRVSNNPIIVSGPSRLRKTLSNQSAPLLRQQPIPENDNTADAGSQCHNWRKRKQHDQVIYQNLYWSVCRITFCEITPYKDHWYRGSTWQNRPSSIFLCQSRLNKRGKNHLKKQPGEKERGKWLGQPVHDNRAC